MLKYIHASQGSCICSRLLYSHQSPSPRTVVALLWQSFFAPPRHRPPIQPITTRCHFLDPTLVSARPCRVVEACGGGFNGQVEFVQNLRFGVFFRKDGKMADSKYSDENFCGTSEAEESGECGLGGTVASNQLYGSGLDDHDRMLYRQACTVQTFEDGTNPNIVTLIKVTTTKRTEYAVCIEQAAAFTVTDVRRTFVPAEENKRS